MVRRLLFVVLVSIVPTETVKTQSAVSGYPGATWETVDPGRAGWSSEKLKEARRYFDALPDGSALVVEHGGDYGV